MKETPDVCTMSNESGAQGRVLGVQRDPFPDESESILVNLCCASGFPFGVGLFFCPWVLRRLLVSNSRSSGGVGRAVKSQG